MNWYKVHNGLPLDMKLAVIAKRTGLRRGDVLALWVVLLDHASQSKPRGSIQDIQAEDIALLLEFDSAGVAAALKAFRDKGLVLADGHLTGWKASQVLSSTQRARDSRARRRQDQDSPLPAQSPPPTARKNDDDSEEAIARRRQRLHEEMSARHKKRGRTFANTPVLSK